MPVKPAGDIYDVLSRAGVATLRGRMVCPHCGKRNLTASASKGVAKCWSCNRAWTTNYEPDAPPHAWDWDSVLMNHFVDAVKDDLLEDGGDAAMYLVDRGLPNDPEFWFENDLGTIPYNIESLVSNWLFEAGTTSKKELDIHHAYITEFRDEVSHLRGDEKKKVLARLNAAKTAIKTITLMFERISANLRLLNWSDWRGALCYVYRDPEGLVSSVNVRQILEEYNTEDHEAERKVIRIQPRCRGVFGGASMVYLPGDGWGGHAPPSVIVEGEHNALALSAAINRWGVAYSLPVIAIGGKNGADLPTIRALVAWDEDPLLVYDNDKVNEATGMPGGYDLVKSLETVLFMRVTTTPTKDLDDWFAAGNRTPRSFFDAIIRPAIPIAKNFKSVVEDVQDALTTKCEANQRTMLVTDIVTRDLQRRANLYTTDGYTSALMRYELEDRLIPIREGTPRFNSLMKRYGLVQPNWVDAAGTAIFIAAIGAPVRKIHSLSHFVNGRLYLNCYDGWMLRISPDGSVKKILNGTDEIFVCPPSPNLDPWLPPGTDLDAEMKKRTGTMRVVPGSVLSEQILERNTRTHQLRE